MIKQKEELTDSDILNIIKKLKYDPNFLISLRSLSNKEYQIIVRYLGY